MSMSNSAETAFLQLIFNATTWADLAENDTTSPATSLYLSLHTGDPGEAGSQTTNEATYGSYARVGVVRTAGGWTVASDTVTNAALVQWPACTSGSNTITYFGVGTLSAGAGQLLFSGVLTSSIPVATPVQPQAAIGALSISVT